MYLTMFVAFIVSFEMTRPHNTRCLPLCASGPSVMQSWAVHLLSHSWPRHIIAAFGSPYTLRTFTFSRTVENMTKKVYRRFLLARSRNVASDVELYAPHPRLCTLRDGRIVMKLLLLSLAVFVLPSQVVLGKPDLYGTG